MLRFFFPLVAGVMLSGQANAQTVNLVAGEVQQAVGKTGDFGASCYVGRGPAFFQRNGAANRAFISFAELSGPPYRDLSGQAWLTFTTTTSGSIQFKYDGAIAWAPFNGYSQYYYAPNSRLTVKFTIRFPGCDLPIVASFDGA